MPFRSSSSRFALRPAAASVVYALLPASTVATEYAARCAAGWDAKMVGFLFLVGLFRFFEGFWFCGFWGWVVVGNFVVALFTMSYSCWCRSLDSTIFRAARWGNGWEPRDESPLWQPEAPDEEFVGYHWWEFICAFWERWERICTWSCSCAHKNMFLYLSEVWLGLRLA